MEPVIVSREAYVRAIHEHEASTEEPIETYKRSVMESIDKDDVMFASAEYIKPGEDMKVVTTYRVLPTYLKD